MLVQQCYVHRLMMLSTCELSGYGWDRAPCSAALSAQATVRLRILCSKLHYIVFKLVSVDVM